MISISVQAQTEEIINSGNSKLHYRIFGKGKPMLIINGGPGMNSDGFTNIAQTLTQYDYQTITYDQRGTGKSTVTSLNSKTITMDLMVEDMENLRQYLNIEKWTLFGHSFGGIMAAYYASKHPERIDKLILSSSGGINMEFTSYVAKRQQANLTQMQRDSLAYFQKKQDQGDTSLETRKGRTKYLAFAYVFDKSKAPIIAERLQQFNGEINNLVIQDLFKINYDCSRKFLNFDRPVLVLQGKNDIITVDTAQKTAKAFPNSKLVLMDHCAHYGWLDVPEVYFANIQSFLNS
ncbi:alpha/beta hydrolase [Flavobacterium sp.]|uniref:alpha/beta fold hydrolase n=1 Tax=Flavobacterium sp. TaxID=239 RepID=UPI00286BE72C|nr:alpha/beta hydrolase [Flavobacterium sp.]